MQEMSGHPSNPMEGAKLKLEVYPNEAILMDMERNTPLSWQL